MPSARNKLVSTSKNSLCVSVFFMRVFTKYKKVPDLLTWYRSYCSMVLIYFSWYQWFAMNNDALATVGGLPRPSLTDGGLPMPALLANAGPLPAIATQSAKA